MIPLCGNFQASCSSDVQCAFNLCNGGLCNGLKPTMSIPEQAKPTGTNLPLGEACDPSLAGACANGANCYASNYMLMPRCGNSQATCSNDSQCAYQRCLGGLCSGPPIRSSSASSMGMSTTTTSSPAKPTGINLGLGQACDPALPNACANGVNCYATNSMLIPQCGNFQASCRTNSDCAYNTCNGGLCNGFLPSTVTASSTLPTTTMASMPGGGATNVTGSATPSTTPPLIANTARSLEAGLVGALGLIFAALLM